MSGLSISSAASSFSPAPVHAARAAANSSTNSGLRVELAKLRKEYSACVNCDSANTQAGKLNIQKLDTQIKSLESRLTTPTQSAAAIQPTPSADTTVGRLIDFYA